MAINIAIDGPSASGKSSLARELCKVLGYVHLDTGAMYRCVALKCLLNNIDTDNQKALEELFDNIKIELLASGKTLLDGKDVSNEIRTDIISQEASKVSAIPYVRTRLVKLQQEMAKEKGFIMDGRDICSVVLPNAEAKFFVTASVKARAQRRYLENLKRGFESNIDEIEKEIAERDYRDSHRDASPLMQTEDAILLDTSDLTLAEVVEVALKTIREKL